MKPKIKNSTLAFLAVILILSTAACFGQTKADQDWRPVQLEVCRFYIPENWQSSSESASYHPPGSDDLYLGLTGKVISPPQELEAALIPSPLGTGLHSQITDRVEQSLPAGKAVQITVKLLNCENGEVSGWESHLVLLIDHPEGKTACDLYLGAPSQTALQKAQPLFHQAAELLEITP